MSKEINAGDRLTIFNVNDFMATCYRYEVKVNDVSKTEKGTVLTLVEKGKRKPFRWLLNKWKIVLKGHDLGLKADTEFNTFCGSASFNLVHDTPEQARKVLEDNLLEPLDDWTKAHIRFKPTSEANNESFDSVPLFETELVDEND